MNEEQKKILAKVRARTASESKPKMGGLEAFGRGALQSVKDIGYGAQQLGAELGEMAGVVDPATVQRLRAEEAKRREENAAFMDTGAGKAGYVAGSIGSMLIPGAALGRAPGLAGAAARGLSAPRTFAGAAVGGGLLGATAPLEGEESRAVSAGTGAIGGLVGQGVSRAVGRALQPTTSKPSPQAARAIERLKAQGIPVDIAEEAGSENLRAVRRFLTDNPISAAGMKKAEEARQAAFNRAALKTIGEKGDAAIPDVIQGAHERIGGVMERIANKNNIKIDDRMLSDLADVEAVARKTVSGDNFTPVRNQLDDILKTIQSGDFITGKAYQSIRTDAANLAKNYPMLTPVTRQLREAIDSALERSVGKADADALRTARKQYRNLMRVEDSIGTTESGDISVPKLAMATSRKAERSAALRNLGDAELARLARSANTVRDSFPQSGTAPRAALQYYGAAAAPAVISGGYDIANTGEISGTTQTAIAAGALGIGGPMALRRAYQNPALRDYILRGVKSPAARRMLMGPTARGAMTYAPAAGLLGPDEE